LITYKSETARLGDFAGCLCARWTLRKRKKIVMGSRRFGLKDLTKTYRNYLAQAKTVYSLRAAFKCINYGSQVLQLAVPPTTSMCFFITFHLFILFSGNNI